MNGHYVTLAAFSRGYIVRVWLDGARDPLETFRYRQHMRAELAAVTLADAHDCAVIYQ